MPGTIDWHYGNIKRCEKLLAKNSQVQENGCRFWTPGLTPAGYGVQTFSPYGKFKAHRLSYLLHMNVGTLDPTLHVRHLCGNSQCVEASHLTTGSASENAADKVGHGTSGHGKGGKLSIEQARELKWNSAHLGGVSTRAAHFAVPGHIVSDMDSGKSWAWLGKTAAEDDKTLKPDDEASRKRKTMLENTPWSEADYDKAETFVQKRIKMIGSEDECFCWTGKINRNGYGICRFREKEVGAHRLSWMAHHRCQIPEGLVVRHKCVGRRECVNFRHLETGTTQDNADDRKRDGTVSQGSKHNKATINEDVARQIKLSKGEGTAKDRASRFGASVRVVESIDQGKCWKHI